MHSQSPVPHPNQIRSACERCRRQKLRCARPAAVSASCARCARLGLTCQPGPQRRIGRPPKKDLALRKASGPALSDEMRLLDGLLDDAASGIEWTMGSPFAFDGPEFMGFPLEDCPLIRELDPPCCEGQAVVPTDPCFERLSRLNVDIHRGLANIARFTTQPRFDDFICTPHAEMDGYKNVQLVLKNAQEFLDVIKALHRKLGIRSMSRLPRHPSPDPLVLTLDPSLIESSTPSPTETLPCDVPPPTHDSPTMFLVISCYVQLIKHLEILQKIVYDSISDPTAAPIGGAPMAYAEVPIIEASSQFVLFCELVYHVFSQMNLVLGLPSAWSGRSAWTGLLRHQYYRNLVNAELGAVDGAWTTRPARLLEVTRMTKEMFVELAMMGLDA
ncbi:hypothetical protein AK830_g876 [Neonectria ditissima]|uniref:Zn(2)-C6 fungal-type domain-containing protein n=1 Tax=Neonectria ditissima TaxID=78410 RepID=A0A0P7BP29_9HYPO|nr:hypothetical protein AK830_g876 [Neonectria ditissima]